MKRFYTLLAVVLLATILGACQDEKKSISPEKKAAIFVKDLYVALDKAAWEQAREILLSADEYSQKLAQRDKETFDKAFEQEKEAMLKETASNIAKAYYEAVDKDNFEAIEELSSQQDQIVALLSEEEGEEFILMVESLVKSHLGL